MRFTIVEGDDHDRECLALASIVPLTLVEVGVDVKANATQCGMIRARIVCRCVRG